MRFLVVGQGGREHALVRALKSSPSVTEVHAVSGSAGMAQEAICHPFSLNDLSEWDSLLKKQSFDCVVVGPEVPLADGLADYLRAKGIATIGPNQMAAKLEASKVFAKEFMVSAGVPTARHVLVDSLSSCLESAKQFEAPYVLKVDGLAAGKGVFICKHGQELEVAAKAIFVERIFGDAGSKALLEEFQAGEEISYLVLTNGREFQPLPVSQDHKRLLDGDQGPNTGGMGVVGPVEIDDGLRARIHSEIVEPTLRQISGMGLLYRGVLYFGIMVTKNGPSLLEYNVRFGDPEAQVILPLFAGDWGAVFLRLANGELEHLNWKPLSATCVVLAAPGYPEQPALGVPISGDLSAQTASSYFLHAGTRLEQGIWQTVGGRVLNAVGIDATLTGAIKAAYQRARSVQWPGMRMRSDIGKKQI